MPGPTPKTADRRQRTNSPAGRVVAFPAGSAVKVPAMPVCLLASTKLLWKSFWDSALAQAVDVATDGAAISRYFTLLDERERAFRAYRRERLVEGSQGQRVLNPMARAMSVFDAEIRQLEDRLGLTPRARLQLGIVFGEAAQSLAALNRSLNEDESDNDDNDPRQ